MYPFDGIRDYIASVDKATMELMKRQSMDAIEATSKAVNTMMGKKPDRFKGFSQVTIFKSRETGEYSLGDGIRQIEDINQEEFEFVYRHLGEHVKARVESVLKSPIRDPNVQEALRCLFTYKNIPIAK